jgi:excisionase family DNA binding protein
MDSVVHERETGAELRPYTVPEFARLARLSPNSIYLMVNRGELPAVRLGKAIRLPRGACDRLLRGEKR